MRSHALSIASLVLLSSLMLAGCGRNPVSPASGIVDGGSTSFAGIQIDEPPLPNENQAGVVGSVALGAGQSGSVQAGRFRLVIPAHALRMDAVITLRQPDPDVMQVVFDITPAAANKFSQPVTLIADCSNDSVEELEGETFYWWQGGWQVAPMTSLDRNQRTLSAFAKDLSNAKVQGAKRGPHAVQEEIAGPDGGGSGGGDDGDILGR